MLSLRNMIVWGYILSMVTVAYMMVEYSSTFVR
jgi:hypothetical protein